MRSGLSSIIMYIEGLYYTQSTSVSVPSSAIGSPPLQQASVSPGKEQHSLAGEGMVGPDPDGWKEILALCVLCDYGPRYMLKESYLVGYRGPGT
jgi:hypothetical protein